MSKYLVIGARKAPIYIPFTGYTGTQTYTSLIKIGEYNTIGQAEKAVKENYDDCGGLIGLFTLGDENHIESSLTGK